MYVTIDVTRPLYAVGTSGFTFLAYRDVVHHWYMGASLCALVAVFCLAQLVLDIYPPRR